MKEKIINDYRDRIQAFFGDALGPKLCSGKRYAVCLKPGWAFYVGFPGFEQTPVGVFISDKLSDVRKALSNAIKYK